MKKFARNFAIIVCLTLLFSMQIRISADPEEVLYFPKYIFKGYSGWTSEDWYSRELRDAQEPSLYTLDIDENEVIYRFTIIESMAIASPTIITVRITLIEKTGLVTIKMRSVSNYWSGLGEEFLTRSSFLNSEQCEEFLNVITDNNFWNISSVETPQIIILPNGIEVLSYTIGSDGSEWIIEGLEYDRYHAISRWSPEINKINDRKNIYEIGSYMLDLAQYYELLWNENFKIIAIN